MTKEQFMLTLKEEMRGLRQQAVEDILYDYEEHFAIGQDKGKSEAEIATALGNPREIAAQYRLQRAVRQAEESKAPRNLLRAIFAGVGMGLFNLIFVLGVYLALFGVLIGLLISAVAVCAAGFLVMLKSFIPGLFMWVNVSFDFGFMTGRVAGFFAGVGTTALGLLLLLFTMKLAELLYKGTLAYVKANITIVKKAGE